MQKETTFDVSGMHCASCASVITRKLKKLPGVSNATVNFGAEKAHVAFDPSQVTVDHMNHAVGPFGYSLHSLHEGHDTTPGSSDQTIKQQKLRDLEQLRRHVLIAIPMVAVSFVVMVWEVGAQPLKMWLPMPKTFMLFFHHLLPLFATYMLFVVGLPYLRGVARFVRHGVANMDTLVGIGTLVAYMYSFILTAFEGVLSSYIDTQNVYYDVTIVVIGFITLGKYLESRSKLKTGEAIEKLLGLQAKNALVVRDGKEVEVLIWGVGS